MHKILMCVNIMAHEIIDNNYILASNRESKNTLLIILSEFVICVIVKHVGPFEVLYGFYLGSRFFR